MVNNLAAGLNVGRLARSGCFLREWTRKAAVVALSRNFHWVEVNRDHAPGGDLVKRFKEWDEPKARPETICAEGTIETFRAPRAGVCGGMAFLDGDLLVAGSRTHIVWVRPETGEVVRKVPVNYGIRALEAAGGALYVMEQPVFGYDTEHRWIQIWPRPRDTVVYKLTLPLQKWDRRVAASKSLPTPLESRALAPFAAKRS